MSNYKLSKFNIFLKKHNLFFVTNTMTGSILELTESEFNSLSKNEIQWMKNPELNLLKEEGIIIDSDFDELNLLRYSYTHAKYDNTISRITICPTLECNFTCSYCYENRVKGFMNDRTQIFLLKFLKNIISSGIKEIFITWYGGEPLLYPEIISKISKEIKKCVLT